MVDLINQFCLARDAESRGRLLSELEHLTERHFEHEEVVLERLFSTAPRDRRMLHMTLSAALVEHSTEHRRRLGEIRAMRRALGSGAVAAEPTLCEDLKAWFVDHAIGAEAQLKTVLQSV